MQQRVRRRLVQLSAHGVDRVHDELRGIRLHPRDADVSAAAAPRLDHVPALGTEPRGDHIVDLARHTAETVGQGASLQLRGPVRAFQHVQNEPCDPITCSHTGIPSLIRLSLTLTFFNLFFDCIIVKERQILNAVNEPDFAEGGSGGVLSFIISLIRSFSLFFFVFLTF